MSDGLSTAVNVADLFSIKGKTAVVTGGSRGIGAMIARGFVESGAKVYITARKADALNEAADALNKAGKAAGNGGECVAIPCDLSTGEACQKFAKDIMAREAKLNILVNNAGANWGATMAEYPEAGFDKVMDLNVKAIFLLTRELLPALEKAATQADPARVINIGSIDALHVPRYENYAYPASKAAVHHLTRVLAVNLGGKFVTVNAIAPGPFESKMTEWMLEQNQTEIEKRCPLRRIGEPGDMAGAALFLASRAGSYVNGATLPVDGGICIL